MGQVRLLGSILVTAVLLAMAPAGATANVGKCENRLHSAGQKLNAAVSKALAKCAAMTRNKGATAKTAESCEKNLAKVFNIGGAPGKGTVSKTVAAIDKLFVPGKEVCSVGSLERLGHLESGFNAPGVKPQDFVATAMAVRAIDLATAEMFAVSGEFQGVLDSLLDQTDCATQRPNLCSLAATQNPDCRVHSCVLSSAADVTFFQSNGSSVSASFQNRVFPLKVCQTSAGVEALPIDLASDYRILFGDALHAVRPAPVVAGANLTLCIEQVRALGWCDCTGNNAPFEPSSCIDARVNNNGGTCSGSGAFCVTNADCPFRETCNAPPVDSCGALLADARKSQGCTQNNGADCLDGGTNRCFDEDTLGRCHSGTYTGRVAHSWTGASGPGDCVLMSTMQVKVLPPAVCRNVSDQAVGACTTPCASPIPCAADATCLTLGGSQCVDPRGPDQVACTADDLLPPSPPMTIPFTTGVSSVAMHDMITNQGGCSAGSVNAGMNCISNQDCNGGTCSNPAPLAFSPPFGSTSRSSGPGNGLSCNQYDTSSLSGFRLYGSVPLPNQVAVNDALAVFELACN